MEIKTNTQLNFKADFISKAKVKKNLVKNFYLNKSVSFIKFDLNSQLDKNAIFSLEKKWFPNGNHHMESFINSRLSESYGEVLHFFGITKQNKNFKEINEDDVLCIAALTENSNPNHNENVYLNFIQTDPKYLNNKNQNPKIKHCGQSLLNKLQETFVNKGLSLISINNSKPFYEKNGFTLTNPTFNAMVWNVNKTNK